MARANKPTPVTDRRHAPKPRAHPKRTDSFPRNLTTTSAHGTINTQPSSSSRSTPKRRSHASPSAASLDAVKPSLDQSACPQCDPGCLTTPIPNWREKSDAAFQRYSIRRDKQSQKYQLSQRDPRTRQRTAYRSLTKRRTTAPVTYHTDEEEHTWHNLAKGHLTGATMKGKAALSHARRTWLTTQSLSGSLRAIPSRSSYYLGSDRYASLNY